MTDLDLDAVQARADAATPGPWRVVERGGGPDADDGSSILWIGYESGDRPEFAWLDPDEATDADAEFIAHARADVPALLARLAEVEADEATLGVAIEEVENANSRLQAERDNLAAENARLRQERDEARAMNFRMLGDQKNLGLRLGNAVAERDDYAARLKAGDDAYRRQCVALCAAEAKVAAMTPVVEAASVLAGHVKVAAAEEEADWDDEPTPAAVLALVVAVDTYVAGQQGHDAPSAPLSATESQDPHLVDHRDTPESKFVLVDHGATGTDNQPKTSTYAMAVNPAVGVTIDPDAIGRLLDEAHAAHEAGTEPTGEPLTVADIKAVRDRLHPPADPAVLDAAIEALADARAVHYGTIIELPGRKYAWQCACGSGRDPSAFLTDWSQAADEMHRHEEMAYVNAVAPHIRRAALLEAEEALEREVYETAVDAQDSEVLQHAVDTIRRLRAGTEQS
ncbi:MAG: hypothetical protein V4515_12595 [Chloroflexota bacterium]